MRAPVGSEEFDRIYHHWLRGASLPTEKIARLSKPMPHTLRWLATQYYSAAAFKALDPRTQHTTRLIVDKLMIEPIAPRSSLQFGDCHSTISMPKPSVSVI